MKQILSRITPYVLRFTHHVSRITHHAPLVAVLLVALLAAAPLWGPGMVNTRGGGDSPFLLVRLQQLVVNLRAGAVPARWMPDGAYGLGYPFFSYYAALPYYLAGLLVLGGIGLLTALKIVQTLGLILAALAMYGWARGLFESHPQRNWAAALAAVAYTVAPFHLVNVYVRGDSLSEFYAFVFYPLILWGIDGLVARRSRNAPLLVAALALAYAGLLLSHNLSAFIFSPFAFLYLLWRASPSRPRALRGDARPGAPRPLPASGPTCRSATRRIAPDRSAICCV